LNSFAEVRVSGEDGNHVDGAAAGSMIEAMRELRLRPRSMWLDFARADQSDRWRRGFGIMAEEYFHELPELRGDVEDALVLICGEVELRRELEDPPHLVEYQRRFPELAEDLSLQFDISRVFADSAELFDLDAAEPEHDLELPGYEFLEELGRGGSGVVFKARQTSLDRLVAVKVLATGGADPKWLARQRQEAEILARLSHPNVVHVYEVGQRGGCLYLVMEFVDGPTLREFAAGKPLEAGEAARLALALADTMHAVHEAGVLHRDLKPSNVLAPRAGQIKITDFGLAKLQSSDSLLTTESSVLGTPSYMSPEQAVGSGQAAGPEIDVYSLGAILYELLTGRPPFLGATVLDTLSLIRDQDPMPPRQLQPKTPADLETICLHCLNKSPLNRYRSAAALAADLRRFLDGAPIQARRATPAVAALMGAVALLLVASVAILTASNASIRREAAAKDAALVTARQAVDQMLMRVANEKLSYMPLGHPLREALLKDALQFYEGFLAQADADSPVRENMAGVLNSLGVMQRELGRYDDACRSLERSVELLQPMVATDPQPPAAREKLVAAVEALAYTWHINPGDSGGRQANFHYRRALEMYEGLERDWPERRQPMVHCLQRLADLAFRRGDLKEAEQLWREAIDEGEAYLEQRPKNADARSNLCWACADLADMIFLPSADRIAEAEPILKQGLKHAAIILSDEPRSGQAREVAAFLQARLAQGYCRTGRAEEAADLCRRAIEGIESLCADFPWNESYWSDAIYIHKGVVRSLQDGGRPGDAAALLRSMVKWIERTAPQVPDEPAPRASLARCRDSLIELLRSSGLEQQAALLKRQAVGQP